MTLRIKLQGEPKPVSDHPAGIKEIGYREGLSQAEYLRRAAGPWKANSKRVVGETEVFVVSPDSIVLAVGKIEGTHDHGDRVAIDIHQVRKHPRVGTALKVPFASHNPLSYADESGEAAVDEKKASISKPVKAKSEKPAKAASKAPRAPKTKSDVAPKAPRARKSKKEKVEV